MTMLSSYELITHEMFALKALFSPQEGLQTQETNAVQKHQRGTEDRSQRVFGGEFYSIQISAKRK